MGGGVDGGHQGGFASGGKDRDYCALVWDVEVSSKGMKQGMYEYGGEEG
jgi:hypothetical protein